MAEQTVVNPLTKSHQHLQVEPQHIISTKNALARKKKKREKAISNEYRSIREETLSKRCRSIASHHEYKQHLSSIITKSLEIKEKHEEQKQKLVDLAKNINLENIKSVF